MKYINLCFFLLITSFVYAQEKFENKEQQEVYAVILQLFDGMRAGDSSMVHASFSDDVRMYTCTMNAEGGLQLQQGNLQSFLNAVGTPHDQVWDEQIWNTKIDVELGVAQVWTEYAFYVGEKFSHCGIDAFQLVNNEGWKIIHLMDTRRKMNCEKPK